MRKSIIDSIQRIRPFDLEEEANINETIAWIKSGAPIFRVQKPNNPSKHLVVVYLIYDSIAKKFLLLKHKKAQQWLPGGGHVEENEYPIDALIRELREELNLEPIFMYKEPVFLSVSETLNESPSHIDVSFCYLLKGDIHQHIEFDKNEFETYKWFSIDDIPYKQSAVNVKRFIDSSTGQVDKFTINICFNQVCWISCIKFVYIIIRKIYCILFC